MLRFLLICALFPTFGLAAVPPIFHSLEGRWVGQFEVATAEGDILQRFKVEHRYWVEGENLKGLSTSELEGNLQFSHSVSYLDGDTLLSVVTSNGEVITYEGALVDGTLIWTPTPPGESSSVQVRETLFRHDEKLYLKIEYKQMVLDADGNPLELDIAGILAREESP